MYNTPVLTIPRATPSDNDAAQYMIMNGTKQYNLCGQFCVAYCMQDNTHTNNIDDYLNYWEAVDLKWWKTIFKSKIARTTSRYDLRKMLSAYDVTPNELTDYSIDMETFYEISDFHQAILGVGINYKGYLVSGGIRHWVVLDSIEIMDSNHGIVTVYNPYTNHMEPYSWQELITSMGTYKQGLWVRR